MGELNRAHTAALTARVAADAAVTALQAALLAAAPPPSPDIPHQGLRAPRLQGLRGMALAAAAAQRSAAADGGLLPVCGAGQRRIIQDVGGLG